MASTQKAIARRRAHAEAAPPPPPLGPRVTDAQLALPSPPWPVRGAGQPMGTASERKQTARSLLEEEAVVIIATLGSDHRSPSTASMHP
jgi:hypothetical protein